MRPPANLVQVGYSFPGKMTRLGSSTGSKLVGTALARAISLGVAAVATALVMRQLGPAQSGVYYVLITIATSAVALGHLSVMHAFVYLWSRGDDRRALGANAVGLGLVSGSGSALMAWVFVHLLGADNVPVGGRYGLLALALLAVPASIILLYLSSLLALDDRIGRVNLATLLGAAVPFGAAVLLYITSRLTLETAVGIWAGFSLLPAVVLIVTLDARPRHLSISLALETLKIGSQYHLATVALVLLLRVDVFLLNAQVSTREVGLYSLAVALAELTFLFTDSLAQVILPRQVANSFQEASLYTARVMRTSLLISALVMMVLLSSGYYLVPLVFGDGFRGSVGAIMSLSPGVVAFATVRTVGGVLIRLNRPLVISGAAVGAMFVNVSLNLLLIPHLGIVGAGLASSLAYVLLASFYTIWLVRATPLPWRILVPKISDLTAPVAALRGGLSVRREDGGEE